MKKLLLCLAFLAFSLSQTYSSCPKEINFAHSEALILVDKTGESFLHVKIPSHYVGKDGRLLLPAEFSITKYGKHPIASFQTYDLETIMALDFLGSHTISIRIGSFYYQHTITF